MYSYLGDGHAQPLRQVDEFCVEGPAVQVHGPEQRLGRAARKQLEAALRVLHVRGHQELHVQVEALHQHGAVEGPRGDRVLRQMRPGKSRKCVHVKKEATN